MNPVKQKPKNKNWHINQTSKFIKGEERERREKKKILKHYTNCTVTSITTGRKGRGRGA